MSMESGTDQIQVIAQHIHCLAIGEEKAHRSHVSIACTPGDERHALSLRARKRTPAQQIKDQVRPARYNAIKQR